MTRRHTPLQQFKEAKTTAQEHNMFVTEKAGTYMLFRRCGAYNTLIGKRTTVGGLRSLVFNAAKVH